MGEEAGPRKFRVGIEAGRARGVVGDGACCEKGRAKCQIRPEVIRVGEVSE